MHAVTTIGTLRLSVERRFTKIHIQAMKVTQNTPEEDRKQTVIELIEGMDDTIENAFDKERNNLGLVDREGHPARVEWRVASTWVSEVIEVTASGYISVHSGRDCAIIELLWLIRLLDTCCTGDQA